MLGYRVQAMGGRVAGWCDVAKVGGPALCCAGRLRTVSICMGMS